MRALRTVGQHVQVETDTAVFTAPHVVIAADAWTNQLLGGLGIQWPLTVTQEQVTYFATPQLRST